ncbi:hypothetical protein KC19_3G247700 [Ceratodon purpureus]|uniref:Uncharacterized protein n=1 Tax=Ceratodon purpureus TaxID=3225 RepID=A0A8T0IQ54_CERPU|nr:hypothetical protein KC19_3G247700 [Ceratodon purpureus]
MRRLLRAYNNDSNACNMGGNLPSLDFAGFSALVGTNATKAGIPYTCLIRSEVPYLNAYVPVGTYGLAQAVLSCIDWRPARILIGAGEAGSMSELCGVKASGNAMYVGLQSATGKLPVRGVVGEAVVLELLRQARKEDLPLIGRDAERPTYVVWAKINQPDNVDGEVHVVGNEGALINYLATSVCVTALVLLAKCHEWFTFALIIIGMSLNATMAFLLRTQTFELPNANPPTGVPPGDSVIVLEDDPDVFCVLRGTEVAIQRLLQKEVTLNAGLLGPWPLFLVSVAFMIFSGVVVLGVPNMRASTQWIFLIVVCVGSLTDLLKGSWNGKRGIAKEAMKKYGIQTVGVKKFGNRTASIACIAACTRQLDTLKAASLCPTTGIVWENWWTALVEILGAGAIDEEEIEKKLDCLSATMPEESDRKLWKILQKDMFAGRRESLTCLMTSNMQHYSFNLVLKDADVD